MQDPVDGAPAVLVKLYNVTQQKHMEAELQTQKEALARSAPKPSVTRQYPTSIHWLSASEHTVKLTHPR